MQPSVSGPVLLERKDRCYSSLLTANVAAGNGLVLGRYVDIDKLTEVERGNRLPYSPSDALEYAVHGKWKRNEDDTNGTHRRRAEKRKLTADTSMKVLL